ncbi:MAG: sulfoxide reductase heme-binding subunit YedZ [Acidobacteria bacterium]|nr:sulfoxide reductase heme-binding subunit YedZ [Acidobacteriota bacterium]MCW5950397.1 sulfoxide reductase heme-binding subunit YedZ [Pyrinomonadaceae bacterium]
MTDANYNKQLVLVNAAIPLVWLGYDAFTGGLGANPIEFFLRATGVLGLIFLLITLSITPLRRLTGRNDLIKVRRSLGLIAFAYVCIHLTTYFVFDRGADLGSMLGDVAERPFITVGMAGFVMLVPLAVTSTNGMIKRLGGKRWQRLHRLIYLIAIAGVVHYYMLVKSDISYPLMFGAVLVLLLLSRAFLTRPGKPKSEARAVSIQ